jgi:hypothetical protein
VIAPQWAEGRRGQRLEQPAVDDQNDDDQIKEPAQQKPAQAQIDDQLRTREGAGDMDLGAG